MAEEITDANFSEKTKKGMVIVDFHAEWCGPCKIMGPVFEKVSKELKDKQFYKVDVDQNPNTSEEHGIRSIPTMIFLKDGKEVDRTMGYMPEPV